MINSGLAVLRALYVLEEQTENPRFKKIIASVREDVEAGMALSDAMERYPVAFDRLYVAMVRAGEAGGALDQTLNRLATQLEKDDSLRRTIKSAMAYPVLIAVFAICVMHRHAALHHPDLREDVRRPRAASCRRSPG